MATEEGKVTGTITEKGARPLAGVDLDALDRGGREVRVGVSNLDGKYSFRIAPGTYNVTAQLLGFAPASKKVAVEAGKTVTLDFTLAALPME